MMFGLRKKSTVNDIADTFADMIRQYDDKHGLVLYYFPEIVQGIRYQFDISILNHDDDWFSVCTLWNDVSSKLWNQPPNRPIISLSDVSNDNDYTEDAYALFHALGHLFLEYKWYPNKVLDKNIIKKYHHVLCACGGKKGNRYRNEPIEQIANKFAERALKDLDVDYTVPLGM